MVRRDDRTPRHHRRRSSTNYHLETQDLRQEKPSRPPGVLTRQCQELRRRKRSESVPRLVRRRTPRHGKLGFRPRIHFDRLKEKHCTSRGLVICTCTQLTLHFGG